MHHLFKRGARVCVVRNSSAGVIAPGTPSTIRLDTQPLAPAGGRNPSSNLFSPGHPAGTDGSIGNVQLSSGLWAMRSSGEAL